MKMNKKLIVPLLATATGLSLAAGFGGAIAWYQFNSQVTASYVGTSVADTHVLQIGHYEEINEQQVMVWERDFVKTSSNLTPCTFGKLLDTPKANSLSAQGWVKPEAGKDVDAGYTGWTSAVEGVNFVQFDVYLRDLVADPTAAGVPAEKISKGYRQAAKDIYLKEVVISCPDEEAQGGATKDISSAGRIHIAPEGASEKNRLISKNAVTNLPLSGQLDLDGDGQPDVKGGYSWTEGRTTPITYGRTGETQTTTPIANITQARDANGGFTDTDVVDVTRKIISTRDDAYVKLTITIWLEGWATLLTDLTDANSGSNVWNPQLSAGTTVRFGLTFDAGK